MLICGIIVFMKLSTTGAFKLLRPKDAINVSDADVKKIQNVLLIIAQDIVSVCEENGIKYWLTGGSCLGAVRHDGFIPWDDDIDINMCRNDYNKFLNVFKNKFKEKYDVHEPKSKGDFSYPATQIRLKGTRYRGINDIDSDECGIYVDLVPVENTFNNVFLRNVHGVGSMALGFIVSCRKFFRFRAFYLGLAKRNSSVHRVFLTKIAIGFFFSFLTLRRWTIIWDLWNRICKNENSIFVSVPTGRKHFYGELRERKGFCDVVSHKFEDKEWNIPSDYDKYLASMYGRGYMKIPKKEEREAHILTELDFGNFV